MRSVSCVSFNTAHTAEDVSAASEFAHLPAKIKEEKPSSDKVVGRDNENKSLPDTKLPSFLKERREREREEDEEDGQVRCGVLTRRRHTHTHTQQ